MVEYALSDDERCCLQVLEHSDMADGNLAPNERIVITYVAFLCSRLLDIKTEAKVSGRNRNVAKLLNILININRA